MHSLHPKCRETNELTPSNQYQLDLTGVQMRALIRLLMQKGVFTNAEWVSAFDEVYGERIE